MYIRLSKNKRNLDYQVYLVEGYLDINKKSKQRILRKYGKLQDLLKENKNALEELKAWAKQETERLLEEQSVDIHFDLSQIQNGNQYPLNYGYVFLQSIYNELQIPEFIQHYQANTSIQYPLNEILELLVYSRALNPASKQKTYHGKGNYFFELPDFSLDDVYRSLSHLAKMKDDLTYHLHKRIQETKGRDCTLVFYDVTNYYFESDITDGFREKFVSKENMETGLVQMGLFIDRDGIPITYELFPGNTHDLMTMKPILEKMKEKYGLGTITIVADKGNNTGDNLSYIDEKEDFYIISQKIRGSGKDFIALVLDEEGYEWSQDGLFKSKTIKRERIVKRKDEPSYTITEHLLCFWSQKEESYQRAKRGSLEERIEKYMENPSLLNASNSFGIKKYFKKIMVDQKTGEVVKAKAMYEFNQEKYERDLALDGYYCIVTNDLKLQPLDIIEHYHQLSKIEESFKVTKSDLEGRPIYVWKEDHIRGHFLTCYLALLLYRLLQHKLDKLYPVHQLKEALNSANAVKLTSGFYLLHDTDELFKRICSSWGVDLNRETMKEETLVKKINQVSKMYSQ
ncbi:MAG TPA: IS1634 family transposase [Bacillota bacterium]|nr:IS1634 family transposase [Bacillota bacterium]